jgi:hypothetical protein
MNQSRLFALAFAMIAPAAAHAQLVSLGLGAGTGVGNRGGSSGGAHANLSLEVKAPVLPGIRGDAYLIDAPEGSGKIAFSVSGVFSAPIPVITPYLIAGWGAYGIGGDSSRSGWNVGVGAKASVVVGPALFLEVRRHDKMARDIVTVGLRF